MTTATAKAFAESLTAISIANVGSWCCFDSPSFQHQNQIWVRLAVAINYSINQSINQTNKQTTATTTTTKGYKKRAMYQERYQCSWNQCRKPINNDWSFRKVFVGNLNYKTTSQALKELMSRTGEVVEVEFFLLWLIFVVIMIGRTIFLSQIIFIVNCDHEQSFSGHCFRRDKTQSRMWDCHVSRIVGCDLGCSRTGRIGLGWAYNLRTTWQELATPTFFC